MTQADLDVAFYSTAATVLPLFVLTLFASRRFLPSRDKQPGWQFVTGLSLLITATGGEAEAFSGLATGKHGPRATVIFCLVLAGVLVALDLVQALLDAYERTEPAARPLRLARLSRSALLTAVFVFLVAYAAVRVIHSAQSA